jgi:hypothetical protein
MAFLRHKTELNKDAMSSRETYPVATSAPYPTYLNALAKNGYVKAACVGPSHKMAYTLIADTGPIAPRPFSDGSILDPNLIPRWMKRVALMLMLSFLIIAAFDWMFVAALLARGAELAPDSQAVTIPSLAPTAAPTAAPDETSSQVLTIPLPETFAGCWSGKVQRSDFIPPRHLSWWARHFERPPKPPEYKFCLIRLGVDRWQMTAADASLDVAWLRAKDPGVELGSSLTVKSFRDRTARVVLHFYLRRGAQEVTCDEHFGLNIQADSTLDVQGRLDCAGRSELVFETAFPKMAGGDGDGNGSVVGAFAR